MKNSGYHMLRSNNPATPELVYCNFTKRLFDPDIQINYGPMRKNDIVWFEVVKDDRNRIDPTPNLRKIDFTKININVGNAIDNRTKQFIALIEGWYHFVTSGRSYSYNSYVQVRTFRNNGGTEDENMYKGETYGNDKDSFRTTTFTRYLKVGERIEIWQRGYKFPAAPPFRFMGHLVPTP